MPRIDSWLEWLTDPADANQLACSPVSSITSDLNVGLHSNANPESELCVAHFLLQWFSYTCIKKGLTLFIIVRMHSEKL